MKIGVSLCCYNRPDYLKRVLDSLVDNPEIQFGMPVHIFQDVGGDAEEEVSKVIEECDIPNKRVVKRPENLGCGRQMIDARRQMFEEFKYDAAFILEDDLVLSPDYIGLTLNLFLFLQDKFDRIGTVQAWHKCHLSVEEKQSVASHVIPTAGHYWAYLMPRSAWLAIKPFMERYEDEFLRPLKAYKDRNNQAICKFFKKEACAPTNPVEYSGFPYSNPDGDWPSSQDGATAIALAKYGFSRFTTKANRALYIGEHGIHFKPKTFQKFGFDTMTLDPIEGDDSRTEFDIQPGVTDGPRSRMPSPENK